MPSFDVVSEFDAHEASNAIDQANREVGTRFDFKGTGSKYVLEEQVITLTSQADFQLQQMLDILRQKLAKRGIDIACMKEEEPEINPIVPDKIKEVSKGMKSINLIDDIRNYLNFYTFYPGMMNRENVIKKIQSMIEELSNMAGSL